MDDDCFIGSPLKKSDLFYIQNNTVVPAIVSTYYLEITKNDVNDNLKKFLSEYNSSKPHGQSPFCFSRYSTYLYLMEYFNKTSALIPDFTHNALPVNINDLEEIYQITLKGKYKSGTLDSLFRVLESYQYQSFILAYTFIKYNRKTRLISYKYIDINSALKANYNFSFFCINAGGEYEYTNLTFKKARIVMEGLFPVPTQFELSSNESLFRSLSFDVTREMEEQISRRNKSKKRYKNIISKIKIITFLTLLAILFLTIIYKKRNDVILLNNLNFRLNIIKKFKNLKDKIN